MYVVVGLEEPSIGFGLLDYGEDQLEIKHASQFFADWV